MTSICIESKKSFQKKFLQEPHLIFPPGELILLASILITMMVL